jgi:hypothetical protein
MNDNYNAIDTRRQGTRECERRIRQGVRCSRPGGRASRPEVWFAPQPRAQAQRLSHFVTARAGSTQLVRRFPKAAKGNTAVKEMRRRRQASRRLAEVRAKNKAA